MLRIYLGYLLIGLCLTLIHCKEPDLQRYAFSHASMGSLFHIIAYSDDSVRLAEVADQAFQELDSLNLMMSDYIPHSELMKLSRASGRNKYIDVSDNLVEILKLSDYWSRWSNGIFDISIGPYSQLWRRAKRQGILPTEDQIEKAGRSVGFENIEFDGHNRVLLKKQNMQLDLGGIAKGYAVDHIFDKLMKHGFPVCLVDGAGDLRAGEAPHDSQGWQVQISNYMDKDSTIFLENQAIATSGDYYRSLEIDGKNYSHIIDPFTGYGISAARAVTVIAADCVTADVLASVFSVVGPDNAFLNQKIPQASRIMIYEREEGRTSRYLIE